MERATMTVAEAAKYLGVCDDTVYTMVKRKEIPHTRVRRRIFFRRDILDEWMKRGGTAVLEKWGSESR